MVKIYFTDKRKKKYVDLNFWSLIKVYVIAALASTIIVWGILITIILFLAVFF